MRFAVVLMGVATLLWGQSDTGELRLTITDPAGLPVPALVEVVSQANHVRRSLQADADGVVAVKRLAFGVYRVRVERSGFTPVTELLEIRSAIPKGRQITLGMAAMETVVVVRDEDTLIDPHRTAAVQRIGPEALQDRIGSTPGRALLDLVDTQPGWLQEANGVLHPRGSEYQTQYVVDGIPLTENRSPAFSPELEPDEVQSMTVRSAGYPAEFGRKLGGVIEVTTGRDARPGFHGRAVANGGSFRSAGGSAMGHVAWGKNTFGVIGDAARTDRFLDPPVEQNFTNAGTDASFSARYERDLSGTDRIGIVLRRGQSRFQVPNEQMQEAAGQRQDRGSEESAGQFTWQHIFSPHWAGDLRAMGREIGATLWSNGLATPIVAAQDRGAREVYLKGTVSAHYGRHEWKAGVEGDFTSLREAFSYRITNRAFFDRDTARRFSFADRRQDREQAAFVQDLMRFGNWTVSAGLRWDRYRLMVTDSALSPRVSAAYYWRAADVVVRGSYDRILQTPAFENLLLASSRAAESINNDAVLHLPVQPSHGNFVEVGVAKGWFRRVRLDANYFQREMSNFADDDLLLNTGVSFPIAFRRARIHGVEAKVEIPGWGPVSGYLSYSNLHGVGYLPVTGGLFLGDEATGLLGSGSFPISQDQRNTARARVRVQVAPRVWTAVGAAYGSGLPVEFEGDRDDAVAQYGERIVDRVNFTRGRVRPNFAVSASAGAVVWKREKQNLRVQADVQNIGGRLNVINFAGLFSGTAVAAPRSGSIRVSVEW